MSEYAILLKEARSKIADLKKPIVATSKEYVPKMYEAIQNEDPNLKPIEVRKRIEDDCKDLWSKRTILDALPDEAKNFVKQKAGKQRNKNKIQNSAAMIAAPKLEEQIVIDTSGNIIPDSKYSHLGSSNNFNSQGSKHKENLDANYDNSLHEQLLDFEICFKFKDIQRHMAPLFNIIGDNGNIWFHGKINKNSGKVVEANFGRIKGIE